MRKPITLFPATLLFTFVLGCETRDCSRRGAAGRDLAGRLGAANEMHDVAEKDKALALIARDAADPGDSTIANQALAAIHAVSVKDKAACSATQRLAKAGKAEAAAATAKAIHDVALRARRWPRSRRAKPAKDPGHGPNDRMHLTGPA